MKSQEHRDGIYQIPRICDAQNSYNSTDCKKYLYAIEHHCGQDFIHLPQVHGKSIEDSARWIRMEEVQSGAGDSLEHGIV